MPHQRLDKATRPQLVQQPPLHPKDNLVRRHPPTTSQTDQLPVTTPAAKSQQINILQPHPLEQLPRTHLAAPPQERPDQAQNLETVHRADQLHAVHIPLPVDPAQLGVERRVLPRPALHCHQADDLAGGVPASSTR